MIKKNLMVICIVLFLGLSTKRVEANPVPFSVEPEFNEKQNKEVTDYFDMTVVPEEETSIQLTITNNSEVENQYEILVENAFTNQNGLIDFHKNEMKNELIPDFTSLTEEVQKINVPANSSLKHAIKINMPTAAYEGVLLGGIRIRELSTATSDAQITNTYSYLIPVKLHQGKQGYPDSLECGQMTIDASHPLQSFFNVSLTNPQPDVLRNLQLSVKIKPKKNHVKEWQDITEKEIQMAPITTTKFSVLLNQPLEAGSYLVKVKGQTASFSQEWEDEIVIDRKTAKTIKEQVGSKKPSQLNWLVILLLVIICVQAFIFLRYRRNKKHEKS